MRTSVPSLLPIFRSEMQVRLLGLILLQPERTWTLHELAKAVGLHSHRFIASSPERRPQA